MGLSPERTLVIKHTFLEVVDKPASRLRAFTDSALELSRPSEGAWHWPSVVHEEEVHSVGFHRSFGAATAPSHGGAAIPDCSRAPEFPSHPSSYAPPGYASTTYHQERHRGPVVVDLNSAVNASPIADLTSAVQASSGALPSGMVARRGERPLEMDYSNPGLPRGGRLADFGHATGSTGVHPSLPSQMWSPPSRALELSTVLPSDSWASGAGIMDRAPGDRTPGNQRSRRQKQGLQGLPVGQLLNPDVQRAADAANLRPQMQLPSQAPSYALHARGAPMQGGETECDTVLSGVGTNSTQLCSLTNDLQVPPLSVPPELESASTATALSEQSMTTVMLRNLPNRYTRSMLLNMLDEEGFEGKYDFVYLPIDFKTHSGLGYAFVDLNQPADAEKLRRHFEGFSRWSLQSDKVCTVSWSHPEQQGLSAHIKRYRNSPVMHGSVPDDWKPVLFVAGQQAPFPPPTKKLRAPHVRPAP